MNRERGALLVLGAGIVSLLFLIAALLGRLASLPSGDKVGREGQSRAYFNALAGWQQACTRLTEEASREAVTHLGQSWSFGIDRQRPPSAWPHGGREAGTGALGMEEPFPSFASSLVVGGRRTSACSGTVKQSYYFEERDYYLLRIEDEAGKLNLNSPGRARLVTLLWRLGREIALTGRENRPLLEPKECLRLAVAREREFGGGFRRLEQLLAVSWRGRALLDSERYRKLVPYLTVHSWRDDSTMRPKGEVIWSSGRTGKGPRFPGWLEREPRYPVNVNTASYPLLAALATGIAGYYEPPGTPAGSGKRMARLSPAQARVFARTIVAFRHQRPFCSWQEFHDFVAGREPGALDPRGMGWNDEEASRAGRDLLVAHFNPNTGFSPGGPGASRLLAKVDLVSWTSEFCFSSMGYFLVESLGVALDGQGRPVATQVQRSEVKLYEVLRHTTQRDFLGPVDAGNLESFQVGKEPVARRVTRTPPGFQGRTVGGMTLQCYPEPDLVLEDDRHRVYLPRNCDEDGRILLATLALPVAGPHDGGPRFRASFEEGFDPEVFAGRTWTVPPPEARMLTATSWPPVPSSPEVTTLFSDVYGERPEVPNLVQGGHLLPDGMWVDAEHPVVYRTAALQGEDASCPGTLIFWLRPRYSESWRLVTCRWRDATSPWVLDGEENGWEKPGLLTNLSWMIQERWGPGVIDELVVWNRVLNPEEIASLRAGGRYYPASGVSQDACYISPPLDWPCLPPARLLTLSWTVYPPENGSAQNVQGDLGEVAPGEGPKTFVSLSRSGGPLAGLSLPRTGPWIPLDLPVTPALGERLRYRLVFDSGPFGPPVLDSPVVDDVTLTISSGTQVLSWQEERLPLLAGPDLSGNP